MYSKDITFVIDRLNYGGASKIFTYVVNLATKIFDNVTVLTFEAPDNQYTFNNNVKLDSLEYDNNMIGLKKYFCKLRDLKRYFIQNNVSLVCAFVNPVIIYCAMCKKNRFFLIGADRGNPEQMPFFNKILSRIFYTKCDQMVFQSQPALKCFSKKIQHKSYVIENPFIPQPNDPGIYVGPREKKIVSVSRLSADKNLLFLIEAFAKSKYSKNFTLNLIGDGDLISEITEKAETLGIKDRIVFEGYKQDTAKHIYDASLYILPSKAEGMPNSLIEAMSLGLPCITSNFMAHNSNTLIEDKVNGLIFDKSDIASLAEAINYILDNPQKALEIGKKAATIRDVLDEKHIEQLWNDFFNRTIAILRGE